jgi:hypothetical protein
MAPGTQRQVVDDGNEQRVYFSPSLLVGGTGPIPCMLSRTFVKHPATILLPNVLAQPSTGKKQNSRADRFLLIIQYQVGQNKTC